MTCTVSVRPAVLCASALCLLLLASGNSSLYAQSRVVGDITNPAAPALDPAVPATTPVPGNETARFLDLQPTDLMATKIIGATVYNRQDEPLGRVTDLVI